uniref:Uncharacterized protein n=1 Tax=Sinocyclocheilus rhinocerous TaxID=307959 RepID=A0A673HEE0_9TELE
MRPPPDPPNLVENTPPRSRDSDTSQHFHFSKEVSCSGSIQALSYLTGSALRNGLHMIFRHDSRSKGTYTLHSKGIKVRETLDTQMGKCPQFSLVLYYNIHKEYWPIY